MDITKLDFNDEVMLAGLQRWVICESPSYDPCAVNRMQELAAHDLAVMGASVAVSYTHLTLPTILLV